MAIYLQIFFKQLFYYANYNPLYRSGKVPKNLIYYAKCT